MRWDFCDFYNYSDMLIILNNFKVNLMNDCFRVELLRAWEPPVSSSVARVCATLEARYCLPVRDKDEKLPNG